MIQYSWLDSEKYHGHPLNFAYVTEKIYQVHGSEMGFQLEEKALESPIQKEFTDHLFSEWLEEPVALGAFKEDRLIGVIEGSIERWHQVFRISNLLVDRAYRKNGIGSELMRKMVTHAAGITGCRGVILETQSCNYPAICFYRRQGFLLNRIDIREYSNEDIQRGEVRLDFFLPLR